MHTSFLEYLNDPHTMEPLRIVATEMRGDFVFEGELVSPSNRFPIVRGIPRFAGYTDKGNYAESFGWQWNRWGRVQFESENVGKPMEGHTLRMWERITAVATKDLRSALVADFGCGSGRFIEIVKMKNARVIGLDLSDAVEIARRNFAGDDKVLVCQADILRPPIRPGTCDGAFSVGVLHHTPDPAKGFLEMANVVRPGGWIAASVYEKGGHYSLPNVNFYRSLFKRLWPLFGHYPPLLYSYITCFLVAPVARHLPLGGMLHLFFPGIILADRRWSLLDTFDSVTPTHQSFHESYEVFQWFKKAGLSNIEPSDWGSTSFHGMKPL